MAYIFVNKSRLRSFAQQSRQVGSKIKNISNDFSRTGRSLDWDIKSSQDINRIISQIENEFDKYARTFDKIAEFFETAYNEYTKLDSDSIENNERALTPSTITSECKTIAEDIMQWFRDNPAAATILLTNPLTAPMLLPYAGKKILDLWNSLDGKQGNLWSKEITTESGKAGVYGQGYEVTEESVKAYLGKANAEIKNDYVSGEVNAYAGKIEGKKEFKFNLLSSESSEDFNLIDSKAELGVKATVASVDGKAKVGGDNLGLQVEGEGHVGVAKASGAAKLNIGSEGINANVEGDLMVSALSGEAKGTISILGLDISGKLEGDAGALGVKGKAGIENNKLVIGGHGAFILGGGAEIQIGLNKTGWKNTVDSAKELYEGTKETYKKTEELLEEVF